MTTLLTSSNVALRSFNDLNRLVQLHPRTQRVQLRCKLAGDIETDESRILLEGVVTSSANYVPLTPISFLERAADVFGDRTSVVFGSSVKYTWEETHSRCLKLASALVQLGISRGDVVRFQFFSFILFKFKIYCKINLNNNYCRLQLWLRMYQQCRSCILQYQWRKQFSAH